MRILFYLLFTLFSVPLIISLTRVEELTTHKYLSFLRGPKPYAKIRGVDFNDINHEEMITWTKEDKVISEISLREFNNDLNGPHERKIFWTYPLFTAYFGETPLTKNILTARLCAFIPQGHTKFLLSAAPDLAKVSFFFNSGTRSYEISCID